MKNGGCWIFLSHSSKDILKVRQIRNEFERLGHNPLAFYLRCLNSKTEQGKQELDNLIKREIDHREWFVFCDSKHAEQSEYVQLEKDYIYSANKQYIWHIDLAKPMEEVLKTVQDICLRIKVFVSYNNKNKSLALPILSHLEEKDFDVWTPEDLCAGVNWLEETKNQIKQAYNYGFALVFYTDEYASQYYCRIELDELIKNNVFTYVVNLTKTPLPSNLRYYKVFDIENKTPTQQEIQTIINTILLDLKSTIK